MAQQKRNLYLRHWDRIDRVRYSRDPYLGSMHVEYHSPLESLPLVPRIPTSLPSFDD